MSALLTMLKSGGATHARLLAGPILIVMVLGCVFTAWFLLRGYKRKDD